METKLTLRLNENVIERAKIYARNHKISLSKMVESYLKTLIDKENPQADDDFEISPFVKSLQTGVKLPVDFDYKKEYRDYLAEKYK